MVTVSNAAALLKIEIPYELAEPVTGNNYHFVVFKAAWIIMAISVLHARERIKYYTSVMGHLYR